MQTTIDIPDHLLKMAKIKAFKEGITLEKLLISCLEKELSDASLKEKAPWTSLREMGSACSLNPQDSGFDEYF